MGYANLKGDTHFFCFRQEIPFSGKFGKKKKKKKNCYFKLGFILLTSLNMQNSMVVFAFSNLDGKFPFRADLLQKIKVKVCFKINFDMQNSMVMFTFSVFD